MKLPVARNRTHIGRETTPDTCPPAETFADELDLFNREELASALEECVFLVTRVESLAAQTNLSRGRRRRLRRFSRRLSTAVSGLDDGLFDPTSMDG